MPLADGPPTTARPPARRPRRSLASSPTETLAQLVGAALIVAQWECRGQSPLPGAWGCPPRQNVTGGWAGRTALVTQSHARVPSTAESREARAAPAATSAPSPVVPSPPTLSPWPRAVRLPPVVQPVPIGEMRPNETVLEEPAGPAYRPRPQWRMALNGSKWLTFRRILFAPARKPMKSTSKRPAAFAAIPGFSRLLHTLHTPLP